MGLEKLTKLHHNMWKKFRNTAEAMQEQLRTVEKRQSKEMELFARHTDKTFAALESALARWSITILAKICGVWDECHTWIFWGQYHFDGSRTLCLLRRGGKSEWNWRWWRKSRSWNCEGPPRPSGIVKLTSWRLIRQGTGSAGKETWIPTDNRAKSLSQGGVDKHPPSPRNPGLWRRLVQVTWRLHGYIWTGTIFMGSAGETSEGQRLRTRWSLVNLGWRRRSTALCESHSKGEGWWNSDGGRSSPTHTNVRIQESRVQFEVREVVCLIYYHQCIWSSKSCDVHRLVWRLLESADGDRVLVTSILLSRSFLHYHFSFRLAFFFKFRGDNKKLARMLNDFIE